MLQLEAIVGSIGILQLDSKVICERDNIKSHTNRQTDKLSDISSGGYPASVK